MVTSDYLVIYPIQLWADMKGHVVKTFKMTDVKLLICQDGLSLVQTSQLQNQLVV